MTGPQTQFRTPSVVVIGAGMTGLLLAIKLREAGITDVQVFEKSDRLGGTWRENTYPGVACDVPAHMYTYAFEPNPDWHHLFAHGDEIQRYFERVADKYRVKEMIHFSEPVTRCVYEHGRWQVSTAKGRELQADFVINATGILHHPAKPKIKGIETYQGAMFHTAEWDHSVDLRGKRIGIIGTGSTAAQAIPELAKVAGKLSVFQRTPQWILPIPNREVGEGERRWLNQKPERVERVRRFFLWALSELLTKAVTGHQPQRAIFSAICKLNLKLSVRDPELRRKLTPNYAVGCKRIVINSTFYPAIQRANVALVTAGIAEINETSIRTSDGVQHDLDVLVLSTGFDPVAYMRPMDVIGRDGLHINEAWKQRIPTYRSVCLPGFPNNFLMLGPNSPIGNYSVIAMSEVQCGYILKLIERWRRKEFDAIEPKPEAVARFRAYVKAGMANTVWVGGCQSWYLDAEGNPILWPYTWQRWVDEMAEPDLGDFETVTFSAPATSG